ncbi:MAG: hypothetical protein ISS57_12325 [Anaerolineales bacterium]|nr:hypothetical protein [Anaerolineales bacterium]
MTDLKIILKQIAAEQTLHLRRDVLRPGVSLSDAISLADDDPRAYHVGVFVGDELVGVATVLHRPADS